jgi:hypothetical protein
VTNLKPSEAIRRAIKTTAPSIGLACEYGNQRTGRVIEIPPIPPNEISSCCLVGAMFVGAGITGVANIFDEAPKRWPGLAETPTKVLREEFGDHFVLAQDLASYLGGVFDESIMTRGEIADWLESRGL